MIMQVFCQLVQAAEKLKITAQEHYRLKIADGIIPARTNNFLYLLLSGFTVARYRGQE